MFGLAVRDQATGTVVSLASDVAQTLAAAELAAKQAADRHDRLVAIVDEWGEPLRWFSGTDAPPQRVAMTDDTPAWVVPVFVSLRADTAAEARSRVVAWLEDEDLPTGDFGVVLVGNEDEITTEG